MKKCPFCAEEIQAEAVVCRYCGRELVGDVIAQPTATLRANEQDQKPSLSGIDLLVTALIPVGGLILALVYLLDAKSRERGLYLIVASIVCWVVWWVICSLTGGFW